MFELRDLTQETVLLSLRDDLSGELIKVEAGPQAITFNILPGRRFLIWRSAVGRAMLSNMTNEKIYALVRRANRRKRTKEEKVNLKEIMASLRDIRENGYSAAYSEVIKGVGAVAVTYSNTYTCGTPRRSTPNIPPTTHHSQKVRQFLCVID